MRLIAGPPQGRGPPHSTALRAGAQGPSCLQHATTGAGAAAHALRHTLFSAMVGGAALMSSTFVSVDAALAAPFTPDQEYVAQAWKQTDKNFVDRRFAGQDWFDRRQKMVKKQYGSRSEAYDEVRAMLTSLNDKYTRFLTPAAYDAVYSAATGDVAGIGVELAAEGADAVAVSSVVEGAPSELAGLKVGDILDEVDGSPLRGLSPEEVAAKVRGPVGSKFRLVVRRAGEAEPLVKLITRAEVKLAAVKSSVESSGGAKVGYVRIKQFSTTTAEDVKAALTSMKGTNAIVLDLRGNSGGYFPGGVDLARLFLKADSPITYVVDKRVQTTTYKAFEDGDFADQPLMLLVDEKTASASEVFSSAIQDNARAKLAGKQTFGKAVIQTVEALDDGSAVVVTIAQYKTPKGTDINQRGIQVDLPRDCPAGAAAMSCLDKDIRSLVSS
jgi:carboxyl-terminal processing protease